MATSLSMLGFATDLPAQQGPEPIPGAETFGPRWQPAGTAQFDLGPAEGRFRILVSLPDQPPPEEGYGIIYALDAGWTFGTLRDAVRMRASPYAHSGARPTVVVGIGWPTDTLIDFDRRGPDLVGQGTEGPGRAATLELIETVLIPRVETALPVDPAHRMILGHSFGGAFALQARAERPGLFSHIAAGSPSIWTDAEALFAAAGPGGAPVLITIGGLETPERAAATGAPADRIARLIERDMFGRAERMAADLGADFVVFDDVGHGASVTAFLARAVAFLWAAE
ncbi:alpha/beta hydrolase [Pseudodonghicola flavimaris]|uniref:Alpha/beta hydrolase-fold protein n=1 Tax=Pseudodonghicola flavimaris TaxID=3050036 RepID=A0ABT7EYQ2_9RHOB|nr:alpha/beta hydrolase-fold protein [Pseudodonghicola flavimaris]MDK3017477.1 alpha/beta hydrolase-fold protein [Pseudodonghicola flavimaris]